VYVKGINIETFGWESFMLHYIVGGIVF
jgi:hypothetical protein